MRRNPPNSNLLTEIRVVQACPADWKQMSGDDRVRHCTHCARNVYNISAMSRKDAAELIRKTEGKVCVRYYRRPGGAIMTKDCAQSVRTTFAKTAKFALSVGSILGLLSLAAILYALPVGESPVKNLLSQVDKKIKAAFGHTEAPEPIMGKLAVPVKPTPKPGKPKPKSKVKSKST